MTKGSLIGHRVLFPESFAVEQLASGSCDVTIARPQMVSNTSKKSSSVSLETLAELCLSEDTDALRPRMYTWTLFGKRVFAEKVG